MWIEVSIAGKRVLLNSELIMLVDPDFDRMRLLVVGGGGTVNFTFDTAEELSAYYEGFNLALNGLDFIFEGTDIHQAGFIRPLLQSKNEALYRHLLLKEVLGDRKN